MGEVREAPALLSAVNAMGEGEGKGGASDNIRTVVEVIEVGTEAMAEGDEVDTEEDGADA